MSDLFLSYKAEDRARVAPLVQALETDGLSVWWDAHIGGGDDWRQTILRHLEAAKCVIVVWSKRSVGPQGTFVRDEATRALKRGSYLPVRIDKIEPPLGFGETQALDLQGWKGDRADPRYIAVRDALRRRLGIKAKAAAGERPAPVVSRRSVLIGAGAIGAVSVAGAGAWLFTHHAGGRNDSIAVLPFANLSGDPNQAYFSDGMAEELRGALSQIPSLRVVARTSSESVRNDDARSAAQRLGVSHILTGSVRRSAQIIRVSAQLVDATGIEQWTQDYDRPTGDTLQIQSNIAANVAQALSLRLGDRPSDFRLVGGTDSPEAQDLYLRADGVLSRGDSETSLRQAQSFLEAALAIDPQYGAAMTRQSGVLNMRGSTFSSSSTDWHSLAAQAEAAAKKATEVAPRYPAAYGALGSCYFWTFRFRPAQDQFDRMQQLAGKTASDLSLLAAFSGILRHFDEALRFNDQAIALDPLNAHVYINKASTLLAMRRFEDAEQAAAEAARLSPDLLEPRAIRARSLLRLGQLEQARAVFAPLASTSGPWTVIGAEIAERTGDRATSNRLLQTMCATDGTLYQCAQIYALQGRKAEAVAALDRAWSTRDPGLAQLQISYEFDSLRSDPAYQAIVKRMNFPA